MRNLLREKPPEIASLFLSSTLSISSVAMGSQLWGFVAKDLKQQEIQSGNLDWTLPG